MPSEVEPTKTKEPKPLSPFDQYGFPHTVTWEWANPQQYTYDMTIAFGEVVAANKVLGEAHPEEPDLLLGEGCGEPDPDRDAVIAGVLSVTATTRRFDTDISTSFTFHPLGLPEDYGQEGDGRLQVEWYFSDGADCDRLGSDNYGISHASVHWSDPTPEGETKSSEFFVILKDYYSPSAPNGDRQWLDDEAFAPGIFGGSNTTEESRQKLYTADTASVQGITLAGRIIP